MKRSIVMVAVVIAGVFAAAGAYMWQRTHATRQSASVGAEAPKTASKTATGDLAPAVTVVRAAPGEFREAVLVTGSLVAREEILVGPEVEGLRIVDVLADEGQMVKKGQTLARLVSDTLDAQLAQNDAALARTTAAIAQARSQIAQAQARLTEARNAFERGRTLQKSGYTSESVLDQREAAARTADAQLAAARDGLTLAEAERAQIEAQRRELAWRRSRTDVQAPADGLISRRNARIGGLASGAAEPMFKIIAGGEIELDAEVTENRLAQVKAGQTARIEVAGAAEVEGKVRLVSPEVDRTSRLGRVRIFIGAAADLKVGAFGRARIDTARSRGIALPVSSVLYGETGAAVQVVNGGRIESRRVKTGLTSDSRIEILEGVSDGELVVAKAGTFLREGDSVRPMLDGQKVSEVQR